MSAKIHQHPLLWYSKALEQILIEGDASSLAGSLEKVRQGISMEESLPIYWIIVGRREVQMHNIPHVGIYKATLSETECRREGCESLSAFSLQLGRTVAICVAVVVDFKAFENSC